MRSSCLLLSFFLSVFYFGVSAQDNTVGLLSYEPWNSYDGYNLIYPHNQPNVYLFNNCGELVHIWEDSLDVRPGNTAYILKNGNLVKAKRPAVVAGNPIWAGGGGGTVEIRSWDNELIWSYTLNDSMERMHHDIAVTQNGTILAIVWELKNEDECVQAGRDTSLLNQDKLWPDKIIEIDPVQDKIIWEWHAWDHLIQDHNADKSNYGVIKDHQELIDLNFVTNGGHPDWMHANAIDHFYDPLMGSDLIVLSVPTFNEVWVIDHTTTTEQAASHFGGFSGIGGDLMYRWGNPLAYDGGDSTDQKLFYQHDIHWNTEFLSEIDPNYGKFAVFNNRVGSDYSQAHLIENTFDAYSYSFLDGNGDFGPDDFDLTLQHPDQQSLFSSGLSSVQFLPNGNALICSGRFGYSFELTPDNEIVWEYKTPLNAGNWATQGDTLNINNNLTFRIKRYPKDYMAFGGKDLSPKGYLELEPDLEFCSKLLPVMEQDHKYSVKLYPNPASDLLTIEWNGGVYVRLEIFDLLGHKILHKDKITGGKYFVDMSDWNAGVYSVRVNGQETRKLIIEH